MLPASLSTYPYHHHNHHSVSGFSLRAGKKPKQDGITAPVAGFADDTEVKKTEFVLGFESNEIQR